MSYQLKRLLPRHRKLMDLMLTGMTQKEAAARLMISKRCASYTVNSAVFQAELRHFVENLNHYVMTRVLHSMWTEHKPRIASAGSVDELCAAHDAYLEANLSRVDRGVLQWAKQQGVRIQVLQEGEELMPRSNYKIICEIAKKACHATMKANLRKSHRCCVRADSVWRPQ